MNDEIWKAWQYIREKAGGELDIVALSGSNMGTKVALILANSSEPPDILHTYNENLVNNYALSGGFIAYNDVLDQMPHYKAFWETVSDEEKDIRFRKRKAGDGKIYSAPAYGTEYENLIAWLYRTDIFI